MYAGEANHVVHLLISACSSACLTNVEAHSCECCQTVTHMIMCAQVQGLAKQTKEDKSSVNMRKPEHAASTKQHAKEQCKAKAAPAPAVNAPQPMQQVKAAPIGARQRQTKSNTVAPSTGRPATAQQSTVLRAQQVKTGLAKKADKAASGDDEEDKFCAACHTKGERIMLLLAEWKMLGSCVMRDKADVLHGCMCMSAQGALAL